MKEYMDKSALLAKIENAIDDSAPSHDQQCPWEDGYYCGLYKAESIIDAIEVKEVDLNEEIEKCLKKHSMLAVGKKDFTDIAKHFFELGLQSAQKEEPKKCMYSKDDFTDEDRKVLCDGCKEECEYSHSVNVPFDSKNYELIEATYYIPKGMCAIIEDDKVIIKKK